MTDRLQGARVLIYSHDTFGLGHLRRCRAIAHSLVDRYKGLSVLILSGSPIIGSFDFRARVDFVRIPGVIKLRNGEYTSLKLHIDLKQTMAIREAIIRQTAAAFAPDLFLVDKEPLGLNGEVGSTLEDLKDRGVTLALGLRDVMDEPMLLRREWDRKRVVPALQDLYDQIWVYGLEAFWDPLAGIDAPASVRDKLIYTGYLPRPLPEHAHMNLPVSTEEPYVLVTAGGGGDGIEMVDWVLRAYETDPDLSPRAIVVLGPFMPQQKQDGFRRRAERLDQVEVLTFDTHIEVLMDRAIGVVGMGGYNTFCEILSLDKPAVIVPRSEPRREQLIRAERAQALGLVRMLGGDDGRPPARMAQAIRDLARQPPPSSVVVPGLLDGLETINTLVERHIGGERPPELAVAYSKA